MNVKGFYSNQFQGSYKKVLCVCSAGLLRSPTAAYVLSLPPYNYNTRSAGASAYGLIKPTTALLSWAEEIVVMEERIGKEIHRLLASPEVAIFLNTPTPVLNLDIPDVYAYRDPELVELIKTRYTSLNKVVSSNSRTPDCQSGSEGAEPSTTAIKQENL